MSTVIVLPVFRNKVNSEINRLSFYSSVVVSGLELFLQCGKMKSPPAVIAIAKPIQCAATKIQSIVTVQG